MMRWRVSSLRHVEKKISQLCADLATRRWGSWSREVPRVHWIGLRRPVADEGYLGRDLFRRRLAGGRSEAALDIIDNDLLEIGGQRRTAERHGLFAVDKNRRGRLLAGGGRGNADVGMVRLAGPGGSPAPSP